MESKYADEFKLFYPYHKELDLLDTTKVFEYIHDNKINMIINAANVGGSRKTGYDIGKTDVVSNNLRIFFNLARSMDNVEKMIHFGSGAEYDRKHYKPKMPENYFDSFVPEDPYGFSKYIMAKFIEKSEKITNLRLFGVYGKYEDYEFKFISNAIVKNLFGLPIVINQNVNFEYLYIDDLMKIVDHFMHNNGQHRVCNAVKGETIDLLSLSRMINDISEKPSEIRIISQGLNVEYSGDSKRLLSEIKDFKFTSHKDAVKGLYQWYKDNLKEIDKAIIEKDESLKNCIIKRN